MSGTGTAENPYDITTALSAGWIRPGDTVWLTEGTYPGSLFCSLSGTYKNPIIIRPLNNARVIIDGAVTINGSYTEWYGIEFTNSVWPIRTTEQAGSSPDDGIPFTVVVTINAPGCKLINCIIYDMACGPGFWIPAINAEIYGCVIYNVGWNSSNEADRGHGHLFYTQNDTGTKTIRDCIAFNSFSTGLKIYSEGGKAQGYNVSRNTIFNAGALYAGTEDFSMNYWVQQPEGGVGYLFESNRSYHARADGDPVIIGLYDSVSGVTLVDNYFPEGITKNCVPILETGNYYGPGVGNAVFVEPNDYISTRAHVTVYNEAGADSVTVDLTAVTGLSIGDTVTAWNVQAGVGNDLQTLTLDDNKCIVIDMQAANRSVAAPIGWTAPATTFPKFGCFVVQKV